MVKVSIILVNFNGLEDTRSCIKSLQESSIEVSIVVVDNGSASNDGDVIQKEYPQVCVINSKKNLGFAAANNKGIDWAMKHGFDHIVLLNNDTVVEKDMISLLLENSDEYSVVVPAMYYYSNPSKLWYGGGVINKWTGNAYHLELTEEKNVSFATGCCMLVHRKTIEKVGMLDERYFMYCEDMDYSIRLSDEGISIRYIPEAKLYHKVGKSSGGSASPFSIYYVTRNRLNCVMEHKDRFSRTAYIFSIVTRYVRMLAAMLKGQEWKAYRDGIRDHKHHVWGRNKYY